MLLQNLQAELADLILNNDLNSDLVHPTTSLIIYRNNILSNLMHTLMEIYPLIKEIVGNDFFQQAALTYIKHYPLCDSNLHQYGEYFSDFISHYPPASHLPYLQEVAAFEWICHCLYFAADHDSLNIAFLETISPDQYEQLHFILHPASMLKKFNYPILRILALCKKEIDSINIDEGGINLLLIRKEWEVKLIPLPPADYVFLQALSNDTSLSEALEKTLIVDKNFDLAEKLSYWIKENIICDSYLSA